VNLLQNFVAGPLALLQSYPWPGNVRELQGALKQAKLQATSRLLLPEFLPDALRRDPGAAAPAPAPSAAATQDLSALIEACLSEYPGKVHEKVIEAVERALFTRVLRQTQGHQARASELLGLNRATLRAKLRSLGLAVDKVLIDESAAERGE
jgi:DNA-binding NtrC family response regulator